jgi:FkbM family methyltransferase
VHSHCSNHFSPLLAVLSTLKHLSLRAACSSIHRAIYAQNYVLEHPSQRIVSENTRLISIDVVYDIGANKGDWSLAWSNILPASQFYLFEASNSHRADLERLPFVSSFSLLGDKEQHVVDFYEPADGSNHTGSSLYLEVMARDGEFKASSSVMRRLDELVKEKGIPAPDFMKLDVQGAELDVLNGAGDLLKSCKLILLEAPICEYN